MIEAFEAIDDESKIGEICTDAPSFIVIVDLVRRPLKLAVRIS